MSNDNKAWPENIYGRYTMHGKAEYSPSGTSSDAESVFIRADLIPAKGEPVAWTSESCLTHIENNPNDCGFIYKKDYSHYRIPLYTSPQPQFTPEQLQSVLDALQDGILGCISAENSTEVKRDLEILNKFQDNIHAAIALLKEMK